MIDRDKVKEIMMYCLFGDHELVNGELPDEFIKAEGITGTFGFHPDRLKERENEVIDMLRQLPDEFFKEKGGGWSFLNMCNDKEGRQWGEHRDMEELVALGTAIGKVKMPLPREMWSALPGGMPYITIDLGE